MIQSEKQFNSKATTDTFDEIYNNFDVSVNETYLAQTGYPFDYPIRWLNDPSMNKRIAIRRLDCTPSTHTFKIRAVAKINETFKVVKRDEEGKPVKNQDGYEYVTITREMADSTPVEVTVTEYDNLSKVMNFISTQFDYELGEDDDVKRGGLEFDYDNEDNTLMLRFINSRLESVPFKILSLTDDPNDNIQLTEFLKFLNQPLDEEHYNTCKTETEEKSFKEVWNRDRLYFHASFLTSRRKFIGKRGDFYQSLTLLYPPPTNESKFYIRFTSNGNKNILIRYCDFDIQFCYIVNYKKTAIL